MGAIAVSIFVSVVAVVGFLYFLFEEKKNVTQNAHLLYLPAMNRNISSPLEVTFERNELFR